MAKAKKESSVNVETEQEESVEIGGVKIVDLAIMPFQVVIESSQYVLVKPSTVKSGVNEGMVKYEPIGYYNDLSRLILKIAREKLVSTPKVYTLESFIKRYEALVGEITDAIGKYNAD